MKVTCKREKQVFDLDGDMDLCLIQDSQDIEALKEHLFGNNVPEWFDYGCYFVKIQDGEYSEIYGCESFTPYLESWVDTITVEY